MPGGAIPTPEEYRPRQTGAFVYTGAGKKQPADAPLEQKLCKDEAIAIQRCLARCNHKQVYCKEAIAAWKTCCERVKAEQASKAAAEG